MTAANHPLSIERQIADLTHQIARAEIFYDLWWQLQGEPLADHIDGMNLYPDFFRFTRHAYLYAMVVQSMVAFDQGKNALSFKNIFKRLKKSGVVSSKIMAAESELRAKRHLWEGLELVRNECFAHRSHLTSYDDVWKRAKVRPRDIYSALELAMSVANVLRQEFGLEPEEHHPSPGEEAAALLAHLQKTAIAG